MVWTTLPDGRVLSYHVLGDPGGVPVVALHGTPGSWRQLRALDQPARARGISLVVPDRPGYGESTHDPRRTIASGAQDLSSLVEACGLGPCAVVGISGGGPTALAAGVLLGGRVRAVATVGGVAPVVSNEATLPDLRMFMRVARHSESVTRALFALTVRAGRRRPDQMLERFARALAAPDARLVRQDGPIRDAFLDDLHHPSLTAARAAARDFFLFAHRWDVDLAQMAVPVHVWHGTLDRNVPLAHALVVAARCPTAVLHVVEGGGHMLFDHLDAVLAGVVGDAGA